MREDEPEELRQAPGVGEEPRHGPDVDPVVGQDQRPRHDEGAERERDDRHLDVVDGDLRGEVLGGGRRVVVLELGRQQRLLGVLGDGDVEGGVGGAQPDPDGDGRDEQEGGRREDGPAAVPDRGRVAGEQEPLEGAGGRGAAAVDGGMGPGDEHREAGEEAGLAEVRAGVGQVARGLLVEPDELASSPAVSVLVRRPLSTSRRSHDGWFRAMNRSMSTMGCSVP